MNALFEFLVVSSLYISISGVLILSIRALMHKLNSSKVAIYKLWILFLVGFVLLMGFQQFKPDVKFTRDIEQIIQLPTITAFSTLTDAVQIQQNQIPWETVAIMVWAMVSVFLILGLALRYRKFKKSLVYNSNCLNDNIVNSPFVASPVAFGIKNPQIFVPPDYQQKFTESQQNLLMQHEQIHCDRNDPLVVMLYKLLTHLFWFHPVLYVLSRYMKKDQEVSCDEIVLNKNNQSLEYSKLLFQLNQLTHDNKNDPELYCSSISMLKERIMLIKNLKPKSFINAFISKSVLLISAVGLLATTTVLANIVKPHNEITNNPKQSESIVVSNQPVQVPVTSISEAVAIPQPSHTVKAPIAPKERENISTNSKAPKPPKVVKVKNIKIIPISQPAPNYPRIAAVEKTSGYVIVEFDVNTDGTVENLQIIESHPKRLFDKEALRSVKKYLFEPITEKTRARQRVEFALGYNKKTASENKESQQHSESVSKVIPISRPEPRYPRIYRQCGIEGFVDVEYEVQTNGKVGDIKIINSNPETPFFKNPAVGSVKKYRFKPMEQIAIVTQRIEFKQDVKYRKCPPITSHFNASHKNFGQKIKQIAKQ